jgi:putative NADH-flavin reductase
MRIAVIGASGWLGGSIVAEATSRGHEVTACGRSADKLASVGAAETVALDVRNVDELAEAIRGHDAVVVAVTDRSTPDRGTIPAAARAVVEAVPRAGVPRVLFVGGGGSLNAPEGGRLVDQPSFPELYKTEALAGAEALDVFRAAPPELNWTFLSPPPDNLVPGEKRGGYRVEGGDEPVTNAAGETAISSGDLAAAVVDELERPQFERQRFTLGYE